jgi:hypothetical protein
MAEVPGMFKVFFPLLYYGLCITMFAFLVMEEDKWDTFDDAVTGEDVDPTPAGRRHAGEYANAEYIISAIGFFLVILDFAVTLIISTIKGTLMTSDIYRVDADSKETIDIVQMVFRKLGVFGAFWAVFQFIAGMHLQGFLIINADAKDDMYMDLLPFLIPPVIGLLTVVLPSVTPGDYTLVSQTGNYM